MNDRHVWCFLGRLPYRDAMSLMDRADARARSHGSGTLMLLEHPATITMGRRETGANLRSEPEALAADGIAVERTDRGGFVTYHGPGQLVGYPVFPLPALGGSVRSMVEGIQRCLARVASGYGVRSETDAERPGLWVGPDKLAAIGLRLRRGVTGHGFAFNLAPALRHYDHLVPCGMTDRGVTSLAALTGVTPPLEQAAERTAAAFATSFGLELSRRGPEEVFS